jgi:hypothetical protein
MSVQYSDVPPGGQMSIPPAITLVRFALQSQAKHGGFKTNFQNDTTSYGYLDQDNYTIRQWLGILGGNASKSIIDTSLYGDIPIEITLAPSDVSML